MTNIIETNSLCKTYGSHTAVNHLDLMVPQGSVYGFIGPNGAGKSTTMKMLLGLIRPTQGTVRLLGQTMNDRNRLSILRHTGSLIESPAGYAHLTAQENLQIVADLKQVPRKDIDRVLEIVHLREYRRRKVGQYSLGMRQRLGIAQALLGSPELLVLDEPTNGLDPAGIQEMRNLIAEMPSRCGATVLISSHLLSELEMIVDRVGIINDGRLLFQGPLDQLRRHSRGEILLETLAPDQARRVLLDHRVPVREGSLPHCLVLPALADAPLAELVRQLADQGAGVIGVTRHTKSLEEIFLSLTENNKEVS